MNLKLKWAFAFPDATRARSQPAVAGGALFIGSQEGTVFALDAKTGCLHWSFQASGEVRTAISVSAWSGSSKQPPLDGPRIYFGDVLANAYALDARSGKLLWRQKVDDHPLATLTGSPVLFRQTLLVPVSSLETGQAASPDYSCCTFRGAVAALNASSGAILWKTYTIPLPAIKQSENKLGVPQLGPSGAAVWNAPTIDENRGRLYFGTGQNYSHPADEHSDTVTALDLVDGEVAWVSQAIKGDAWNASCFGGDGPNCPEENGPDADISSSPILVRSASGRDIIVAGSKNGEAFGLDPDQNGKIVWRRRLGRGALSGAIHFGMAAQGAIVFVPIADSDLFPAPRYYRGPPKPSMNAVDGFTGQLLWSSRASDGCPSGRQCVGYSAAITAIPGVIFAGSLDGLLRAFDSQNGKTIWLFDTAKHFKAINGDVAIGSTMDGPGPVIADGMVYVNSGYGIYGGLPGNALLAFSSN